MRLYLAEKPSQARDIAAAIGGARAGNGSITVRDGVVTWALGHLLEQATPETYNEAWGGRWNFENLPMIPDVWKQVVVRQKSTQVKVIRELLKGCKEVVIATDAGREGELIAREILTYLKYRGPVKRLWTSSLVQSDIKKALAALQPGSQTEPLHEAALARAHADWLYGMNGSRAVTLGAQNAGTAYPVGRVQTPTLGLVVRREWEIRNFVVSAYYELEAEVQSASGSKFKMFHAPAEKDRIKDRAEAERRKTLASGARSPLDVKTEPKSEAPPLPYTLPALQKDANRLLGLSARNTLKLAQELYEAKAITYPRTDCQYLAASQKGEVEPTLDRLAKMFPGAVAAVRAAGITLRDSTFNDAKLTDHHGICPTVQDAGGTGEAGKLFALIAERYLRTISPDCKFNRTTVLMDANGVPFKATGRQVTDPGFRGVTILSEVDEDKDE
jgi:DNA topoisomerase III